MIIETVLTNARVVLCDTVIEGTIVLIDGVIAAVDEGKSRASSAHDCEGDYLMPGFVELHTDHLERHIAPRPGVRWPEVPAVLAHDAQLAVSGITTVLDAVVIGTATSDSLRRELLALQLNGLEQARAAGALRIDHHLHLRCEVSDPDVIELFERHRSEPRLRLVSVMDHTPGQRQFVSVDKYKEYYMGKHGMTEEEVDRQIAIYRNGHDTVADRYRRHIADACRSDNMPLASHDDATEAHVAEAIGLGASMAEFPTTMEAAKAAREQGMGIIGGAPNLVRGGSHSGNVAVHDLARAGLLDILSSDYVPASLLHAVFTLHTEHGLPLPASTRMVSETPARHARFDDRGAIRPGYRADVIRVHVDETGPRVRETWVAGTRVV